MQLHCTCNQFVFQILFHAACLTLLHLTVHWNNMSASLAQLRDLIQQRFPSAAAPVFKESAPASESPALLPGRLVEIVGPTSGLVLQRFIHGQRTALVDGADAFDPAGIDPADLQRLLWVRCRKAAEAIRAADLLLRDGNLPAVLLDLRLLPQRDLLSLPSSIWHRLRMLAERGDAAAAVFSPCKVVACAARRWFLTQEHTLADLEPHGEALGLAA